MGVDVENSNMKGKVANYNKTTSDLLVDNHDILLFDTLGVTISFSKMNI